MTSDQRAEAARDIIIAKFENKLVKSRTREEMGESTEVRSSDPLTHKQASNGIVSASTMSNLQERYMKAASALRHSVETQSALLVECRSLKEQLVEVTSQLQAAAFLNDGKLMMHWISIITN